MSIKKRSFGKKRSIRKPRSVRKKRSVRRMRGGRKQSFRRMRGGTHGGPGGPGGTTPIGANPSTHKYATIEPDYEYSDTVDARLQNLEKIVEELNKSVKKLQDSVNNEDLSKRTLKKTTAVLDADYAVGQHSNSSYGSVRQLKPERPLAPNHQTIPSPLYNNTKGPRLAGSPRFRQASSQSGWV